MMIIMLSLRIKVDDWKLVPIQDGIFAFLIPINIVIIMQALIIEHHHRLIIMMSRMMMNICIRNRTNHPLRRVVQDPDGVRGGICEYLLHKVFGARPLPGLRCQEPV